MTVRGPLELACEVARLLDDLDVPYALGGSLASSLVGEPRSTVDVDIAAGLDAATARALVERLDASFYVPSEAIDRAVEAATSFNVVDVDSALKVDLFVTGAGLLDRRQLERRRAVELPGTDERIWVTSTEDQVLRKLDWYRQTDAISDRQWRDVLGLLSVNVGSLDLAYLRSTAAQVGLEVLLEEALDEAEA